MKVNDFKLLSTLPVEFDYELFPQGEDGILVIGKQHQTIIGFLMKNNELSQVRFEKQDF